VTEAEPRQQKTNCLEARILPGDYTLLVINHPCTLDTGFGAGVK